MRFALATLTATQAVLAQQPEIGAESIFHASAIEAIEMGKIVTDSAGVASWKPRASAAIPGAGWDLHLRTDDGLKNLAGNPTVTLSVTIGDSVGAGTATATIAVPAWVADQSKNWPVGHAVDFIPQGVGNTDKDIEAITLISVASTNLPPNTELSVFATPPAASLVEIGYCKSINGPYQVPGSVRIADRYESARAVKKGRAEDADLALEFNHISSMDGLARYNGSRILAWVKVVKSKAVHTENVLYTGYVPQVSPSRGDGNDDVMESSTGPYERFLTFTAG